MKLGSRMGFALLLALAVVAAVGCGGSSATGEETEDPLAAYPKGPTRQFIDPGGDNAVQEYGREATPAERAHVSTVVEGWLRAEARGEWAKACRYMHEKSIAYAMRVRTELKKERATSCAKALAFVKTQQPEPTRDNIEGGVASLRIANGHGFAQYHGKEGRDWVLSVRRDEDGDWKVSDLRPLERFK